MTAIATPAVPIARRARPHAARMGGAAAFIFALIASIFCLQYSTYLIHWLFWDRAIKLGALLLLVIGFPYRKLQPKHGVTLLYYLGLFATVIIGSLAAGSGIGITQLSKVIIAWSILPLILFRFGSSDAPPPRVLIRVLQFWAVLWVIQELAMWWRVFTLNPPPDTWIMNLEKLGEGSETHSFGIYGYSNAFGWMADGFLFFRPQGWFTEPSYLASFTMYPTFLALGMFFQRKSVRRFLLFVLLAAGILLTFSLGGYMALSAGLLSFFLVRPSKKRIGGFRRFVLPILVGVMFVAFAQFLLGRMHAIYERKEFTGEAGAAEHLLGRDPKTQKLVQSYFKISEMTALLIERPLGVGLGHTLGKHEMNSPSSPVYWAMAGGIPAIVILFALYVHLVYAYALPLLLSRVPTYRGIAAGFLALTVQGLQIGNWMFPYYLMVTAIMMLAANHVRTHPELQHVRPRA